MAVGALVAAGRLLVVDPEFFLDGGFGCHLAAVATTLSLQVQNRTLAERASAQQSEIENLKLHTRNVENQLIRAEEDLARVDDRSKADPHKLASSKRQRDGFESQPGYGGNVMPAELSSRLADLADRYPSLHYDDESGVSKFDTDVLFDSGEEAQLDGSGAFSDARRIRRQIFPGPRGPRSEDHGRGPYRMRAASKGAKHARNTPTIGILSAQPGPVAAGRLPAREAGLPENRTWGSPALPNINRFRPTTPPRPASAIGASRSSSWGPKLRSSAGPETLGERRLPLAKWGGLSSTATLDPSGFLCNWRAGRGLTWSRAVGRRHAGRAGRCHLYFAGSGVSIII